MKRQGRSKIECDNYQIIDDVGKEVIITVQGWMRFNKIISKYDFIKSHPPTLRSLSNNSRLSTLTDNVEYRFNIDRYISN